MKSTTHWAANATINRPTPAWLGATSAIANTPAAPSANHAFGIWSSNRLGRLVPRMIPGACASAKAIATAIGTTAGGIANRRGTNAS